MIYDLTAVYFYECKGCFDAYQSLLPMFSNFICLFFGVEKQPFVVEEEDQGCHVTGLLMGCWLQWHSHFCVHGYKESMKRANIYAHYVYSVSVANYACRLHKLCLHPWGPSLEGINWENKWDSIQLKSFFHLAYKRRWKSVGITSPLVLVVKWPDSKMSSITW